MRDDEPQTHEPRTPPPSAAFARRSFLALLALGGVGSLAACAVPDDAPAAATSTAVVAPSASRSSSAPPASPSPTASSTQAPEPLGPARQVAHGSRSSDAVALTFHGAGDPALADRLLTELERRSAPATVMAVGTWLEQNPGMAERITSRGHELGNHTWHHRPMLRMSESAAYVEIEGGRRVVSRHVATTTWFRPSGTQDATAAILTAAGRAGYRTSLSFDVDPHDYADPGATAVVDRVLRDARGGSVVSLHLGHVGTVRAIPEIVAGLQAKGLRLVTVSDLLPGVRP